MPTTNQLVREFEKVLGPTLEQVRTNFFPENDCNVVTGLVPATGEFCAYVEDEFEPRGYGHNRYAAIADLVEKRGRAEPEEFDHQAAPADHARDLRKHGVA